MTTIPVSAPNPRDEQISPALGIRLLACFSRYLSAVARVVRSAWVPGARGVEGPR